jgi:hypothetical protein
MPTKRCTAPLTVLALLAMPALTMAQTAQQSTTLAVSGLTGQIPVIQVQGRSYVDVESLTRLTSGSLSFHGNQMTLTLNLPKPPAANASAVVPPAPDKFSREFLAAGIEEMASIREWRAALMRAVQSNYPVVDSWVGDFRRAADKQLALAMAAIKTDADRNAFALLKNEFNNMQTNSQKYLQMKSNNQYIPTDSFDNDTLDQQILTCSRALAGMAAAGTFQDDFSCH